jgi:hypothetical protein
MPEKFIMTVIIVLSFGLIMPGPVAPGNTELAEIRQVNRRYEALAESLSRESGSTTSGRA